MGNGCEHHSGEQETYDIWHADKNAKLYQNEMLRYYHLLNLLPKNIKNILDVGCGVGYMSYLMARQWIQVTALDLSKDRLAMFEEIARQLNITQIQGDLFQFDQHNFDAIIAQEVLEHIEDYQSALKKMLHFVKGNMFALFCVPYRENLQAKMKICPNCGLPYHKNGHLHSFTKKDFTRSIIDAGFKILQVHLIVNKRTVRWISKAKLSVNNFTLVIDRLMNLLFPNKAAYLAVLCQREENLSKD